MVVDDSVVVRRVVSDVLGSDPAIEVAGVAVNGRNALERLPRLAPDLVVLDLEMPEMDGLAALAEIRKGWPRLPVIMYSTLTRRGATATLDALALGASDYLTKPDGAERPADAVQRVRDELIPKVKSLCARVVGAPDVPARAVVRPPAPAAPRPTRGPVNGRIGVVAIGCSTGGPNALAALMPVFPADFPVPVVIVQHMPPIFTQMLAERLTSISKVRVHEATQGQPVLPGQAYIAPGGYHMAVARDRGGVRAVLNQGPQENSCRPAVDVLFRSVAAAYPSSALAVILTGIGQDGMRGCEAIRQAGGLVYAQDEVSSVVWGMPGSVVRAGLADRTLSLDVIGHAVSSRVTQSPSPAEVAG
jgi:two-component system chemotaxis response regulator CheB